MFGARLPSFVLGNAIFHSLESFLFFLTFMESCGRKAMCLGCVGCRKKSYIECLGSGVFP